MSDESIDRNTPAPAPVTLRVVAGVCGVWMLIALLWGAQTALTSNLGGKPVPLVGALQSSLRESLPWIPVTLAIIALTIRFPISRAHRWRHVLVHVVAAPLLALAANVLLVLGYWVTNDKFDGLGELFGEGAKWAGMRLHIAFLIYIAILAITQGALYYRKTRARELHLARLEGQLARARLQALNAQIRPHFLFNTLHTIGQLWRSGRSDDADAVLDHLGSLFHKVQSCTSRLEMPLSEELDLVREYLAIEETRFRDRLHVTVCAAPDTLDCLVPPLILQPLVENAVRHGISKVSSAGVVEVIAKIADGMLRLTVRDDGPGIGTASSQPGSGTGLRNTRERLAQLYGPAGRLHIGDAPGGGTLVGLDIPLARDRAEALHV